MGHDQEDVQATRPTPAEDVGVSCNFLLVMGCAAFAIGGAGLYFGISKGLKDGLTPEVFIAIAVSLASVVNGVAVYVFGGIGLNTAAAAKNSELQVKLLKRIAFQTQRQDEPTTSG